MLCTQVVSLGPSGGIVSGGGAYWRWSGLGMVNGIAGNGEYCGRFGL